jgi:type III pantothenate kinase
MFLCLDIGNSQIHGGVFDKHDELQLQFRYNTSHVGSSDQFATFLLQVLRENNIDPDLIAKVAIASVVPSVDHSIASAFVKYFKLNPMFLQPGIKTGIKINSNNAAEIGADLIAGAVGGVTKYPNQPLLIFDFGTATTVIYITPAQEFIGGAVLPGIRLMMESLENNTAKLFNVSISQPKQVISKDTKLAIQSGLYYSQIGAVREFVNQIVNEQQLNRQDLVVIGTGGFANLLNTANIFDAIIPDLLLIGLKQILKINE